VHGEPFRSPWEAVAAPRQAVLVDELAARRMPRELARRHDMILVAAWDEDGVLAMLDPGDEAAAREAEAATGLRLIRFTALASQLRLAIERCWQPRPDVPVPATGSVREALPFGTAVGVPLAVAVLGFLFVFREALDLRHHFAVAALACGLFFFSYALRYYVTTAAVVGAVLFGDRLRRQRIVSQLRASAGVDLRKLSLEALGAAAGDGVVAPGAGPPGRANGSRVPPGGPKDPPKAKHDYKTLRGERLDDIGAIVTAAPARIGQYRLPRERQPFVSIHLAMYNERQVADRLLRACTSFDYDNYEVVVADDSTDPEALAILERWAAHPRVRVLHRPTRKGFKGGALQDALRRMDERTEYVMIFDADFIPPPDAIWHFLDYFGRLPGPGGENGHGYHAGDLKGVADGVPVNGDRLAAVQGYQWHMLNASENWITKGIRTEFSGSYVLERAAQELFGTMKMISGSVYMIRADVLRRLGWSTSITEDWELTIRLYLAGYKVLYTPYIQAPSECVSRIKQLVRQRMRWARGHTFNVKRYFFPVLRSPNMSWREKLEFLYYAPYYLQSILFLLGTVAWVLGIFLLGQRLPQWGEALGWSLVVSNVIALPLMNLAGLVLEGSVRRDIVGLGSFVGLSTLLVPFQGWAALRGLLEPTEGGWDRTPKSGRITEAVGALRLGKILPWELPRRRKPSSRAAHILVTCIAGFLAGAILAVGALSMRAAASSGKVAEGDLVLPFVSGTLLPLAVVAYGWLRLHRRIAVCVLAAAIGLSSNVIFLANTIPASATAGNSSVFTFQATPTAATAFLPGFPNMTQGYTPTAGTATTCPSTRGYNWTCSFASDAFTSAQYLNGDNSQADLYLENDPIPKFLGSSSVPFGGSGGFSLSRPAAAQNGAVLIAAAAVRGGSGTSVTAPDATWTALGRVDNGTTISIVSFWHVVTNAGAESSYSFTTSPSVKGAAALLAYAGVDTTAPVDLQAGQWTASGTSHTAPELTTTVANQMLVTFHAVAGSTSSWGQWTPPPAMSCCERVDTATNTQSAASNAGLEANDLFIPSSGTATGAQTATSVYSGVGATKTITLKPPTTPRSCTVTATLKVHSPIWLRSYTTATVDSSNTITIDRPAGTAANDVLVFLGGHYPGGGSYSAPAGFFWIDLESGISGDIVGVYKVATASEPATYSFTLGGSSGSIVGWLGAFVGVDTASPTDGVESGSITTSTTSHTTWAGVTTTTQYDLVVAAFRVNASGATWTPPSDMAEVAEVSNTTGATPTAMGVNYGSHSIGSTGTKTATSSIAGTGIYHMFALRALAANTTTLGSATVTATSPSGPTLLTTPSFSTTGITFIDGEHLLLDVSVPNDPANCAVRLSYDSTGQPSKLTSSTIVPEGLLGLLLLAPALPIAIRRRWIRSPWGRAT
jgi:cellulose synthase/poly-beta-1,6-N-acetylglucosamine synthase-like glycosyltransferase